MTPRLPRSVGLRPVFFPPERCLRHRSIHTHPAPVDAVQFVKLLDPGIPEFQEDASLNPLLKAVMRSRFGTQVGVRESFPLTAGAQNVEDGVGAPAIGDTGAAAAEAVGVEAHRDERLQDGPESVGNTEAGGGWIIARALA